VYNNSYSLTYLLTFRIPEAAAMCSVLRGFFYLVNADVGLNKGKLCIDNRRVVKWDCIAICCTELMYDQRSSWLVV